MRRLFIVFVAIIFAGALHAGAATQPKLSNTAPVQGDTLILSFAKGDSPSSGKAMGKDLSFFTYHNAKMAILPIPAGQNPGTYSYAITFDDKKSVKGSFTVKKRTFVKVTLGVTKDLGLTTDGLLQKLGEQKASIDSIVKDVSQDVRFEKSFGLPLYNSTRIGSPFGEIRDTDGSIVRHWGVDFGGKEGASVGAMSGGVVKSAYFDTVYGNTIIIDHGEGIYTIYMHLKQRNVKEDDVVERGDVIGLLGHTGYSTAPHLHLSMKINSVPVDPIRFVNAFKKY